MTPEIIIVRDWHVALNHGSVDQMIALVDEQVEIRGPRGSTRGAQVVRDWFARANIRLYPTRFFQRGGVVIAEQAAQWRDPDTGEVTSHQVVASLFHVSGQRLTFIQRFESLAAALDAGGLTPDDELPLD